MESNLERIVNDFIGYLGEAVMLFMALFIVVMFVVSLMAVLKKDEEKGE